METTTQLDLKEMGRRIKSKREYLHMSREALAETIDVSTQFVFDIEAGHKGTTIRRLLKICQALDLSPNYLLIGKISEQDESGAKKTFARRNIGIAFPLHNKTAGRRAGHLANLRR